MIRSLPLRITLIKPPVPTEKSVSLSFQTLTDI